MAILVQMAKKAKRFLITTETRETIRLIGGKDPDIDMICPVCMSRLRLESADDQKSEPHRNEIVSLTQQNEKK